DLVRRRVAAGTLRTDELIAGAIVGLVLVVGSTVLIVRYVARMPADYFVRSRPRPDHPVLAVLAIASRNLAGALLLIVGVVLALPGVPGPGVATIFIGFVLLDSPGKRRLELRLLRRPRLRAAIDRLRARHQQPPLELPPEPHPDTPGPS